MTDELRELCSAAIEDRLTNEQNRRLEELLRASAENLRFYVEYLHQHAALSWSAGGFSDAPRSVGNSGASSDREPLARSWFTRMLPFAALAACLLLAIGWFTSRSTESPAFATLTEVKAGKWDGGTLPTLEGARLTAGRLKLAEGLATIVFDSGAEVRLEGPADLELKDGAHCVLRGGRLVAKVPPPAIGFVVDTPTAELTDLGTEFGVHVRDGQTADVQVFNGLVDAKHLATGKVERMPTGESLRFETDTVTPFDPLLESPPSAPPPLGGDRSKVLTLTTAMGRGIDGYAQPAVETPHRSDVLILVKSTTAEKSAFNRKGYIGIDLSSLGEELVTEAQLTLTMAPTGMGFSSEVPDSTFTVYGLLDESLDNWTARELTWESAPANRPTPTGLDPAKTMKIGQFIVPQGVQTGTVTVEGPTLAEFLNRDTNGLATFIFVRETLGSGRSDYVHGFANRNHPTLPPPTLKVTGE